MTDLSLSAKSHKIITTCLKSSSDIVSYILEEKNLKNSISNFYGDCSPEIQCKVAWIHLGDTVSDHSLDILSEMERRVSYDLSLFFVSLFKAIFPASISALDLKYRELKQGSLSIVGYARILRVITEKLGYHLGNQKFKFILGINDQRIKEVLLRADLNLYDLQGLVEYAISLESSLSLSDELLAKKEGSKEEKVYVSKNYFKLAKEKGLKKGLCYNCITQYHSCSSCPLDHCKFCKKKNRDVKHFSLGCSKCPGKL